MFYFISYFYRGSFSCFFSHFRLSHRKTASLFRSAKLRELLTMALYYLSVLLTLTQSCTALVHGEGPTNRKPNFVMIMTDDQDLHLDSLKYQPAVQKHFADEGTFYKKHFCTIALCCPSRVSLWTGMAGHNTNVTDVRLPYGRYQTSSRSLV